MKSDLTVGHRLLLGDKGEDNRCGSYPPGMCTFKSAVTGQNWVSHLRLVWCAFRTLTLRLLFENPKYVGQRQSAIFAFLEGMGLSPHL